jgi:hypothetical protein
VPIRVKDIIVLPDRQRGGKLEGKKDGFENGETLKGLQGSIKRLGFFSPIGVRKWGLTDEQKEAGNAILVYGNRRIVATGEEFVPGRIITPHPDDPNPEATFAELEFSETCFDSHEIS